MSKLGRPIMPDVPTVVFSIFFLPAVALTSAAAGVMLLRGMTREVVYTVIDFKNAKIR